VKEEKKHRIFVVEDHPIMLKGLIVLLEQEPDLEVCGSAANAEETVAGVERLSPDLVILDVSLQGINGLELLKILKGKFPDIQALLFSMHEELFYAERALRAGALGYIMKSEPPEKVLGAVRRVLSGDVYVSDRVGKQMLHQMAKGKSGLRNSTIGLLSNRELEVVQFIGEGRDNRQIAEKMNLSIKTVEAHRSRIKEKLKLSSSSELIRFAVHWVEHESSFI
jgi:DNA-binding NarL/FixJ family response regulator